MATAGTHADEYVFDAGDDDRYDSLVLPTGVQLVIDQVG
jgi:hypothetical protein